MPLTADADVHSTTNVGGAGSSFPSPGETLGLGSSIKSDPNTQPHSSDSPQRQKMQHMMAKPQALFDNFYKELYSLREVTKDCLRLFSDDRERRFANIHSMKSRIAYLRQMTGLNRSKMVMGGLPMLNATAVMEERSSIGLGALEDSTENTFNSPTALSARREKDDGWASCFHLSFINGVGNGMPPSWRRSVQDRSKEEQQNEKGLDYQDEAEDKLQDRIVLRKSEIIALENRISVVDYEISTLRGDISLLQADFRKARRRYKREKMDLLGRINAVQFSNENMNRMQIETEVLLEERHINTEILANELKRVRKELLAEQNEKNRRKSEQRRKDFDSSRNIFLSEVDDRERGTSQVNEINLKKDQTQQKSIHGNLSVCNQQFYGTSENMHQHRTSAISSIGDDDTSGISNFQGKHGCNDCGDSQDLNLSPSQFTCMSSVTQDSCTFVDLLEQLERHNESTK